MSRDSINLNMKDIEDKGFLKRLLATITDGVMVVDREGRILSLNRAAEEITGYRENEVRGMACSVLDTDACAMHTVKGKSIGCTLFKKGKVKNKRCQIRGKNGRFVHLLKNAVLLKDKKGRTIGAVETMTDITSLFMKDMEIEKLRSELNKEHGFMGMIGNSPEMEKIYGQINDAAQSDVPIIILGESGTGKELVARAVHKLSRRNTRDYVRVNCAALNEYLLESELFGHKKGSFTGAISDRKGRFEAANRGSLFLDEIGDMSIAMQSKLLRVLQEKEIERIGENHPIKVDVRVIAATNKDIDTMVAEGNFREDLLYRINVFPINLPPLRDRVDDIPMLVSHYLQSIPSVHQDEIKGMSREALEILKSYNWPGNIRQLINVLEYGAITCKGEMIDIDHLPSYLFERRPADKTNRDDHEKQAILTALKENNYHRAKTSEQMKISRVALWKKMKRLGITV